MLYTVASIAIIYACLVQFSCKHVSHTHMQLDMICTVLSSLLS